MFEGERGLQGHSDADAAAHAIADALLGAAGLGDIGQHFPDTDPQWRGADSLVLLREVAMQVRVAGFVVGNVDCTIVLEATRNWRPCATRWRRTSATRSTGTSTSKRPGPSRSERSAGAKASPVSPSPS